MQIHIKGMDEADMAADKSMDEATALFAYFQKRDTDPRIAAMACVTAAGAMLGALGVERSEFNASHVVALLTTAWEAVPAMDGVRPVRHGFNPGGFTI